MIDHIVLKNPKTLELQEETPEKAMLTCKHLENLKAREKMLARRNQGLPTDYDISVDGTKITISGLALFAVITFHKYKALSEDRRNSLSLELRELSKRDKIAAQLGAGGIYAKRQINIDEIKKKKIALEKSRAKTQKLIDKQNLEDQKEELEEKSNLSTYKSSL